MYGKHTWISVSLVIVALLSLNGAAQAEPFTPDFFPINPWCSHYTVGLKSMADGNFTTGGFFVDQVDLSWADTLGLKAILPSGLPRGYWDLMTWSNAEIQAQVQAAVAGTSNDPRVLGYFIIDEPGAVSFAKLRVAVDAVKTYAPGKLAYINLFPNHARPADQLWTATYAQYLESYVSQVQPQMISYDNYKILTGSEASYFTNLIQVRDVAIANGLPFWNFVDSCQIGGVGDIPTLQNVALQAYTSLAAGARGLSWYRYYDSGTTVHAPIDSPGVDYLNKSPTWYYLEDVNGQVVTLAPTLLQLTSTGVYFTSPKPDPSLPELPGSLIRDIDAGYPLPLMIGEFEHENGDDYAMIVNLNETGSGIFTIELEDYPYDEFYIVSSATGEFLPHDISSPLSIEAGHGVLIQLAPEPATLLGDANLDTLVSADDYASVQANFGNTGDPGGTLLGDANHDGLVGADDYASIQANFGNHLPEPATLGLLLLGGLALLRRRR